MSFPEEQREGQLHINNHSCRIKTLFVCSTNISLFLYDSIYIGDGASFISGVGRSMGKVWGKKTLAKAMLTKVHMPAICHYFMRWEYSYNSIRYRVYMGAGAEQESMRCSTE